MSQISSNTKNNRVTIRNRIRNKRYKLAIKKAIKQYLLSINKDKFKYITSSKSLEVRLESLSLVYRRLDKAVKRKVLHKNTAARKKSRLAKLLK